MDDEKTINSRQKVIRIWNKKPSLQKVLLLAGITILLIAGFLTLLRYNATHGTPVLPNPSLTISSGSDQPDETKPSNVAQSEYTVPTDQPRRISIKSVGIDGLIQRVGLTKDNVMAVPSNVYFAGWYVNSVLPGKPGLSIINGHVSGVYKDGVFKQMQKVKANDAVEIEFGDRSSKKFIVVETKALPAKQSAQDLFTPHEGITSQLNLVTCDGKFDTTTQSYENRIIVTTKLVDY